MSGDFGRDFVIIYGFESKLLMSESRFVNIVTEKRFNTPDLSISSDYLASKTHLWFLDLEKIINSITLKPDLSKPLS